MQYGGVTKKTIESAVKSASNKVVTDVAEFNGVARNAIKGYKFEQKKGVSATPPIFKTEIEYQNSFQRIIAFSKKYLSDDINYIIYHDFNNDGIMSAFSAWRYLVKDHGKEDIQFNGLKPALGTGEIVVTPIRKILGDLSGKNVLILDLSYNKKTLDAIREVASSLIIIDDHSTTVGDENEGVFVSEIHATCSQTWKFFYPTQPVPQVIMLVGISDKKIFVPFASFSHLFNTAMGIRFFNNVRLKGKHNFIHGGLFDQLDEVVDQRGDFYVFIGRYMEEFKDNVKLEIANNARAVDFQGFRVGALNFDSPALAKVVARQIITNFRKSKTPIDFAVLWAYHYTTGEYRVQLIDDHQQTRLNMGDLAKRLGAKGGAERAGGGHPHVGNFYWKRDIRELFEKKFL